MSETLLKPSRRSSSGLSTASVLSVSSSALSQAISSIDNGKNAVVIEIGTKLTKLGSSGEPTPRHIIRTEFVDTDGTLIGAEDIFALNNQKTIKKSIEYYEEVLKKYFKFLFFKGLAPADRPIVLVEDVFMSEDMRNTITKVILESLRCKSLLFVPSHLCATFPLNTQNALVVDIGHSECVAMPIIEGVTMLNDFTSARSICGRQIERRVRELLQKYGKIEDSNGERTNISIEDWQEIDKMNLVETISVNLVCPNSQKSEEWKKWEEAEDEKPQVEPVVKEKSILINGKTVIIPPVVFETSAEIFFDETLNKESFDLSLPKILFNLVEKCPIDTRKKLFSNIILIGGSSLIPGLQYRLQEEIKQFAIEKKSKIADQVLFYNFPTLRNFPLFGSWLGASLLASLRETIERRSITVADWRNGKMAPNWTDIIVKPR